MVRRYMISKITNLKMSFGKYVSLILVSSMAMMSGCSQEQGAEQPKMETSEQSSSQSTSKPPVPAGHPEIPVNHPPQQQASSQSSTQLPSGIRFAHFKVGNRNVKSMLADGEIIWVGTSGGVIRYDTRVQDYTLFNVRSGELLSNGIFHLSKHQGKLYVGTYGGGLSVLDEASGEWKNYNIQHGLADSFVYDVEILDNGELWIATWSGANRIFDGELDNPEKWRTYTVENTDGGLPNDWVYGLNKGTNGELWLATEGGLARFMDEKWQTWKHDDGLGAPYELVKDEIKFKRDPAKESSHHARQKVEMGLTDVDVAYNPNYIVSLYVDDNGIVWAGTWGGGLTRFDGKEWSYFTVKDGLPSNHIFMLGPERNGNIWVGTSDGLARFEDGKFTVFTVHDGLYTNNVFSMANADDGGLWLGGFGGVTHLVGIDNAKKSR